MWHAVVLLLLAAPSWTFTLQETLQRSYKEQPFGTILWLQHRKQLPCKQMEEVATNVTRPILRFNNEAKFYLKSSQSSEMLALICLSGNQEMDMEVWQALAKNLCNMRHVRVLLLQQEEKDLRQLLEQLKDITAQLKLPQVLLIAATGHVYQLQPYAKDAWLQLDLNSSNPIFVRQDNYQLKVAYTLPDQITPLSLVYKDKKKKELRMTGFVASLIQEFVRSHNISLQWQRPVVAGEELSLILLRNMTLNGTLNLPITLCGYEVASEVGIFTYPFDIPSWFIMVPCAREIATADVYPLLFNWRMLALILMSYCLFVLLDLSLNSLLMGKSYDWTNFMCNERMISGILGQPSNLWSHYTISSRVTQAQLFIVGLMISTVFAAHLKTLLTKRPTERKISNFQELHKSKISIFFEEGERFYLNQMRSNNPMYPIKPKIEYLQANEFYAQRKSLHNPQGFSITSTEWNMIKRQQELFYRPAFCFEPDLIFRRNLFMSVPLEANSIYAASLDLFIHRIHSSGLLNYWKEKSVRDLIVLGEISVKDPYEYEPFHEFKVGDLLWVWLCLFLGLLFGLIAFLCELITYRIELKISLRNPQFLTQNNSYFFTP